MASRMAGAIDRLQSRYQPALDKELRESFVGQEGLLYNMLLYQLGWMDSQGMELSGPSGRRLHPLLCLLSCEALTGEYDQAVPAAAAVELVHNFSLIHEDVQAGSPNRGHRSTIWWIWGPGQAINAGDGMHALARLTLMRLQDRGMPISRVIRALRLLDQSCLSMFEGQQLDLVFQERLDVGVGSYLTMAEGKTGALMSCAMGLGALAATEDEDTVEAFRKCGKYVGIAHQISTDIDDLRKGSSEEGPPDNLLNKKKLLPIVYALETGDLHAKRELGDIYFKRVLEPSDAERLTALLNEQSALEYAQERAEEYCVNAIGALEGLAISVQGREDLEQTLRGIITVDG